MEPFQALHSQSQQELIIIQDSVGQQENDSAPIQLQLDELFDDDFEQFLQAVKVVRLDLGVSNLYN